MPCPRPPVCESCAGQRGERSRGQAAGCAPGLGKAFVGSSREPPLKGKEMETQRHTVAARPPLLEAPASVRCFLWASLVPRWVSRGAQVLGAPRARANPLRVDRTWQVHLLPRKAAAPRVPTGDLSGLGLSAALHAPASVRGSGAVCGWAHSRSRCSRGEAGRQARQPALCSVAQLDQFYVCPWWL